MSRSLLLIVIGALVVVAATVGYLYYQERQTGLEINIDGQGVTIDGN